MHGYLPATFMQSAIIPLIKDKAGDTNDKNNYRPVALVTPCSKLFELVLLSIMEDFLVTSDNQFGFKRGHATDMCIYAMKSVIEYYKHYNSPVYTCFLDASKAFDKVCHWRLFKKLLERQVPLLIVRLLMYWYQHQTACVKWGAYTSVFLLSQTALDKVGFSHQNCF